MKLGIGTAQFGMNYGVANPAGRVTRAHAMEILNIAALEGVRVIDTAPAYGSSEQTLGELLPTGRHFRLVTKTVPVDGARIGKDYATDVLTGLRASLKKLQAESIYGVLVHDASAFDRPGAEYLMQALEEVKAQGSVTRIGVSVYDRAEIERIFRTFPLDFVQLPVSVFDQRLVKSGHLLWLKELGVEIHARSVFLQGLMFLEPEHLIGEFTEAGKSIERLRQIATKRGTTAAGLALSYVSNIKEIDTVICGVNDPGQFCALVAIAKRPVEVDDETVRALAVNDPNIVNPSRWPQCVTQRQS